MKKLLLLISTIAFGSFSFAQSGGTTNKKAESLFASASQQVQYGNAEKAAELLESAILEDPKFLDALNALGNLYFNPLMQYDKAIEIFKKSIAVNPDYNSIVYWGLGNAYFDKGEYSEAKLAFSKYITYPKAPAQNVSRAKAMILHCDFIPTALAHPVPFEAKNAGAGVNTDDDEYFPAVTADNKYLYFTNGKMGKPYTEDVFCSVYGKSEWGPAFNIGAPINMPDGDEGAHTISPDGRYMLFTMCDNPENIGSCDIWISKRLGDSWGEPKNMGSAINSAYWESQPSISSDSRSIYFISKRPGGQGMGDIWMSSFKDGAGWTDAVNLGPTINTPLPEERPFIHPDNVTLYFTSAGHPGMGELDIYYSRKDDAGNWQTPVNIGYPINTADIESGLFVSTDGKTAYFSAVRKDGFGGEDIYYFDLPAEARPKPTTFVKGRIFDKETDQNLDANYQLFDVASGKLILTGKSDAKTGFFLNTLTVGKDYMFNVNKEGYLFYSDNFSLINHSPDKPYLIEIGLERPKPSSQPVVLKNVFFETAKFELLPASTTELDKLVDLLQKLPEVKIEIGGHTDSNGDDAGNLLLSQNRAKAVNDYLVAKGISQNRLTYKGYGETKPIADNATEVGRASNRRTEFMVVP